jgi:hypothetical protein
MNYEAAGKLGRLLWRGGYSTVEEAWIYFVDNF